MTTQQPATTPRLATSPPRARRSIPTQPSHIQSGQNSVPHTLGYAKFTLTFLRELQGVAFKRLSLSLVAALWMVPREASAQLLDAVSISSTPQAAQCERAAARSEQAHQIPTGLLAAIARVESGRAAGGGILEPWPWTVNAQGQGLFFASKVAAVAWVGQAEAAGITSIDTGCLQVNLHYHPDAFRSLEEAFDITTNADYAGRFLRQLVEGPAHGDWLVAAGLYHSSTPDRASEYRAKVAAELRGPSASRSAGAWRIASSAMCAGTMSDPIGGNSAVAEGRSTAVRENPSLRPQLTRHASARIVLRPQLAAAAMCRGPA